MAKIYMVANWGYDYDGFDILQLCSTKEVAEDYLNNISQTLPNVLPWNERGVLEIDLDVPLENQIGKDA